MLTETFDIEINRRWYSDNHMDLIIWHDENNQITGFQLCYDKCKTDGEKALTWTREKGFTHSSIDNSSGFAHCKSSPMLSSGGMFQYQRVTRDFLKRAKSLPIEILGFIFSKLAVYSMTTVKENTDNLPKSSKRPMSDTIYFQQHGHQINILINSTQADF